MEPPGDYSDRSRSTRFDDIGEPETTPLPPRPPSHITTSTTRAPETTTPASHSTPAFQTNQRPVSSEVRRKEGLLTTQEFEQLNPDAVVPLPDYTPLQQPQEPSVAPAQSNRDAPTEVRIKEGLLTPAEFELRNPDAVYVQPHAVTPQAVTTISEEPTPTPPPSSFHSQNARSSVNLPPLVPSFNTKFANTMESQTTSQATTTMGVPLFGAGPHPPPPSAVFPNGSTTHSNNNQSNCCVIL